MDKPEYWGDYMQKIRTNINEGLSKQNISVRQKYLWLKDKYNKALSDILIVNYDQNFGIKLERL